MSDNDAVDLVGYRLLITSLRRMGRAIANVFRHARLQDPSRKGINYHVAMHLETRVERLVEAVEELVRFRSISAVYLRSMADTIQYNSW